MVAITKQFHFWSIKVILLFHILRFTVSLWSGRTQAITKLYVYIIYIVLVSTAYEHECCSILWVACFFTSLCTQQVHVHVLSCDWDGRACVRSGTGLGGWRIIYNVEPSKELCAMPLGLLFLSGTLDSVHDSCPLSALMSLLVSSCVPVGYTVATLVTWFCI